MDAQPWPAAARVVGLEAASSKLREVLGTVLLLADKEQDQVAGVMQGMVQRLLLASRLKALSPDLLAAITRKAGRPTRRAARLLRDAYGPLDCGLHLRDINTPQDFTTLLGANPARFARITSLVLGNRGNAIIYSDEFVTVLTTALPYLASLSLSNLPRISCASLACLAPLAPRLTALSAPMVADPLQTALPTLLPLTALRSLAFTSGFSHTADVAALRCLSALHQLQHLQFRDVNTNTLYPAGAWLSSLSTLSSLTSLAAWSLLSSFDAAAVSMLRTVLPRLSALTLLLTELGDDEQLGTDADSDSGSNSMVVSPFDEVLASLAQRTALTSLYLEVDIMLDLRCVSHLQLSRLGLRYDPPAGSVVELLEALSVQSQLTALHLGGVSEYLDFTGTAGLRLLAGRLRQLVLQSVDPKHVGGFAGGLSLLTELTLLDIEANRGRLAWLAGLTSLEVLHFGERCRGSCCKALLLEVGSLTRLRQLSVDFHAPVEGEGKEVVRDADLWKLLPLRHTLTRLVLGRSQWAIDHPQYELDQGAKAQGVEGPGLGVVGKLTGLKELALVQLAVLGSPLLPDYLLPLPPGLRRLEVEWHREGRPSQEVCKCLQAAAALQDCDVQLGVV